ncbi:hypothetical protein SprV_0100398600 [Sparganum proliferum]
MTMRLPIRGNKFVTIVSAYVFSMTESSDVKNKSYGGLHALQAIVQKVDKLVVSRMEENMHITDTYVFFQCCTRRKGGRKIRVLADEYNRSGRNWEVVIHVKRTAYATQTTLSAHTSA